MRASRSLSAWTENLWIYDLRTNKHFTLKENPLKREDLDEFVACYNPRTAMNEKSPSVSRVFPTKTYLSATSSTSTSCATTNPLLPMQRIFLQVG